MALGILSSGLELTLDAVERERARYAAGSDLRILLGAHFTPLDLSALQGVQSASRAWRGTGSVNLVGGRSTPQIEILAIEPLSFASVTRYRADYAEESIGALMGNLILDEAYQAKMLVPLPGEPARFGLWVYDKQSPFNSARLVDLINLQVKLQTAQKESFILPLVLRPVPGRASDQYVPPAEWRYFEAELPALDPASYPLGLHSLWVKALRGARDAFEILQIGVDDFSVSDRQGGATTVVEDFELHAYMWETNSPGFQAVFTRRTPALSGSGTLSLWLPGGLYSQMQALYLVSGFQLEQPLPALASQEFMAHTQLAVGDHMDGFVNGSTVPLVIVGVVRYFPTLYDLPGQSFLVLPRDPLLTILNRQQRNPSNPNEVWLELEDPGSAGTVSDQVPGAAGALSYLGELRAIKADPLTLGLRSVTLLGALLAALLSLAGFATYFYMSLYRRETTFAILRSLGLSSGQLISMLAVEQLLMILVGLLLGTGLGLLLNRLVLPGLPLSLGGRPPVPPLLPLTDWMGLAQFLIFLLLAFSLVLGSAAVALWRSRLQQLLRIGQE
jgi:hypothetical protein